MEVQNNNFVIDENGNKHFINLEDKLGEGTQGSVYRTKNKNILIKLIKKNKIRSLKLTVQRIKSFNFSKNLNLAIPILNLETKTNFYEGYVMELMEDMQPILNLILTSFSDEEKFNNWYKETGGLKRRIKILSNIARNLYFLHSKGIVYGDISPNNIFISENKDFCETWFIDTDNIDYHYDIDYTIGSPIFCSPEIRKSLPPYNLSKEFNTIENDIYAFANLAFFLIFLADPFRGGILNTFLKNEEDDWEEENDWCEEDELGKRIDLGNISWVGEGDLENKPIYGLSPEIDKVITPKLKDLFNRTLGEKGRKILKTRPSMRVWLEELTNLYNILNSEKCSCGYRYYNYNERCKNCSKKKKEILKIDVIFKNNRNTRELIREYIEEGRIEFSNSDLGIGKFDEREEKAFELIKEKEKFYIKNYLKDIEEIKIGKNEIIKKLLTKKTEIFDFEEIIISKKDLEIAIRRI